jgi:hypothetical protein
MSTSAMAGATGPDALTTRRGRLVLTAVVVAGAAFVAEAVVSVFVDSHISYHALNAVLNAALLVAGSNFALAGLRAVGRAGVVGGWATAFMALLAFAGGIWAVLVEGLSSAESPGVVAGIAHSAVLASLLFLVPLGLGLRRLALVPGYVIAGSSACLVTMVLAGLDQPEAFLVPEAVLGLGWLLLSRSLPTSDDSALR